MTIFRVAAVSFLVFFLVASCGGPQRNLKLSTHGHATAISTPADLRLSFLREDQSKQVYCAEPLPDVALGSEQTASGKLAGTFATAQAASAATTAALMEENKTLRKELNDAVREYERETGGKYERNLSSNVTVNSSANSSLNLEAAYGLAVKVSELGGRSQQVLLAREFLYRVCEARANRFFIDDQAYIDLQVKALGMIEAISTTKKPSVVAEKTALLQKVNEYNKQQSERCAAAFKACKSAKKTNCVETRDKCEKPLTFEALGLPAPRTLPQGEVPSLAQERPTIKAFSPLDKKGSYTVGSDGRLVRTQ